ncbi:MAG: TraU family protein [Sideroxydans sp.]|nr:TraU family protein [Sideroxydans sp.]MDD5056648.1 TraU family protein [Sideroxydans sp.]
MKNLFLSALLFAVSLSANAGSVCNGQFMNPISDVCWDCAFPIKLFGQKITSGDGEDYDSYNPSGIEKVVCACNVGPVQITGIPVSFWEFTRQVDVTRTPYCLVGLGQRMNVDINSNIDGGKSRTTTDDPGATFRHVHWYINPILGLMEIILDSKCLESKGFDLAYMSELDKTWLDEELARIMTPEAYLFNNIVAQLACGADCIAATTGMSSISNAMFWCAGCNGALYPLDGWTTASYSGVQMSSLLVQRMAAKQHRMMTQASSAGKDAMCGAGHLEVTMDKRQYKFSMLFPVPQAEAKDNGIGGSGSTISGCCQPFGRSTVLWGSGRELPFIGEDFAYGIFRKRDCCQ